PAASRSTRRARSRARMIAGRTAAPPEFNQDFRRGFGRAGGTFRHASAGLRWPVGRSIRAPSMTILRQAALAALFSLAGSSAAGAHRHVWVTARGEIVYAADGKLQEIRHAWTFDEMFSAFATQGLDKNNDGKLSREELADLAKENVESLKEFNYFTASPKGEK